MKRPRTKEAPETPEISAEGPRRKRVFRQLTRFHLAREIEEWGWRIGKHTYGAPIVLEPELASLSIGAFCSIARDVTIVLGNHRTDLATTYPFKALSEHWPAAEHCGPDHDSKGDVVIHDDVWLGSGACVLSGSEIGHGAVVAAQAVVSGPVPPYAIVAGAPARVIRKRFDDETIERLLKAAWWTWPDREISKALPLLLAPDIQAFLAHAESRPARPRRAR